MASVSFISASKLAELLSAADELRNMYVCVASANRLTLGVDPLKPTLMIDLSKEKVGPYNRPEPEPTAVPPTNARQPPITNGSVPRRSRHTGDCWFEIKGRRVKCRSSKERLAEGLRELEQAAPGTFEKLSSVKPRSRRIVAHDRNHLYDKSHLVERYTEQLMPGWWHGTNNNDQQKEIWLKRACDYAGLTWGMDFRIGPAPSVQIFDDL
jgi:hypothetical protein